MQLGLELGDLRPRGEHRGQRGALVARDLLRQERVHEPAAAHDVARVGVLEPGEDPQQRRLAAAVGAEHADPRAGGQLEVEPVEDAAAAEGLREPAGGDQGDARHGPFSIGRGTERGKAGSTRIHGRATPHPHRPATAPTSSSAVRDGGGELAPLEDADGLVWLGGEPGRAARACPTRVRWVQLPSAGVEQWLRAGVVADGRAWTSATGAFGLPVAEHALALMLAADKALHSFARERSWRSADGRHHVRALEGETVAIVGAGGIGRALIGLLEPFGAEVIAVTRRGRDVPGAARTLPADRVAEAWGEAHHVVIAAPATDGTRHLVGARRAGGDARGRVAGQRRPRLARGHRRARGGAARRARSPAPRSTSPTPSRCPTATRCGSCRTC